MNTAATPPVPAVCFHCAQPLPEGARYGLAVGGCWRPVCCAGCEAVAGAILGQGLGDFYRLRDSAPETAPDPAARDATAGDADLALYDHPDLQRGFVHEVEDPRARGAKTCEATLILEGIRCPACVWLNEQALARVPGVLEAQANFATRRATVRWDPRAARLSQILQAVRRVGYRAAPFDPRRADALRARERRDALWRLFVAGFGMMQVMMYALPAYVAGEGEMSADLAQLLRWASLALTLPVVFYAAAPFFRGALRDLAARRAGMDVPVALGIAIAFTASVAGTLSGAAEVYYDSVSMFVFLLLLGRFLEVLARQRAGRALDHLSRLAPDFANRLVRFPGALDVQRAAAVTLARGEHVLVKPGEAVPADGVVVQGSGTVSEALLTGESRPVPKRPGSPVIGGSVNVSEALVVRVERTGAQTMLAGILRMVEQAAGQKPRLAQLADRWVPLFIASVVALALAAGFAWAFVDPARSVAVMVAVLVATCPCALSLATPVALTVATGELARRGLIVTGGHALEALAAASDVVFDKTGTLTSGELSLAAVAALREVPAADCVALAAAIESACGHPIARAFAATQPARVAPDSIRNFPGEGIEARIDGRVYRIGSASFAHPAALPDPAARGSVVWLSDAAGPLARFEIAAALRPEAQACVQALAEAGLRVHLLSGDDARAVEQAARSLRIAHAQARVTPERKRAYVRAIQARGARVAVVGDGINDAPVLAQADVSVALASGARLAQIHADAVMPGEDLRALPAAVRTARTCASIIRQNVAWAFAYNLTVLPLALGGLLTPWVAALGMSASSLLVIANALRLQAQRTAGADRTGGSLALRGSADPA